MLQTDRLDLVPSTLEHLEAELQSPNRLGRLLGVSVPPDWPPGEYDRDAMHHFHSRLKAAGPSHIGWYGWYGMTRKLDGSRHELVVAAGFFGPPHNGTVEIGYSVISSARCKGFASEMVMALLDHAFREPVVQAIMAHTTDSNLASCKVLLNCGFHRVGPGSEPDSIQFRKLRA